MALVGLVILILAFLFTLPNHGLVMVAPDMAHFIMNVDPKILLVLEHCLNLDNASSVYSYAALIETTLANVRGSYETDPFSSVKRALEYSKLSRYPIFHNNILSLTKLNHNPKCAEAVIQELKNLGFSYHCRIRPHAEKGLYEEIYPLVEKMLGEPENYNHGEGIETNFISDHFYPLGSFLQAVGPRLSLDGAFNVLKKVNGLYNRQTFEDYFSRDPYNILMFVKMVNSALLTKDKLPFEIDAEFSIHPESVVLLDIFFDWINLSGDRYLPENVERAFADIPQQLIALLADSMSAEERQWISATLIETLYTMREIAGFDADQHQSTIDLIVEHLNPWDLTASLRRTFLDVFSAHLPPRFIQVWKSNDHKTTMSKLDLYRLSNMILLDWNRLYRRCPVFLPENDLYSALVRIISSQQSLVMINKRLEQPMRTESRETIYSLYEAAILFAHLIEEKSAAFGILTESGLPCWKPDHQYASEIRAIINTLNVFLQLEMPFPLNLQSLFVIDTHRVKPMLCRTSYPLLWRSMKNIFANAFKLTPINQFFTPDEFVNLLQ